jgi:pimeloyl-ACP methyl ester carboxylesterase
MRTSPQKLHRSACVTYFSGFCLKGEEKLFGEFLVESEVTVAGFSYGAQQALENALTLPTRVDRLILLSPAFFQNQPSTFKKSQLHYFQKHQSSYVKQFLKNVVYPSKIDLNPYFQLGKREELQALLHYQWEKEKFQQLKERGITIEIFIGGKDKIIDADAAFTFFETLGICYFMKEAGHLLKLDDED